MTLRYWGQLLDDSPMYLGSLSATYCIYMCDSKPNVSYWKTDTAFVIWGLASCFVYIFVMIPGFYIVCFGTQTTLALVIAYFKSSKVQWATPLSSYLLVGFFSVVATGSFIWISNRVYCSVTQPYQLHSIWHLCSGYGAYLAAYFTVSIRAQFLDRKCELRMIKLCNIVPVFHYLIYAEEEADLAKAQGTRTSVPSTGRPTRAPRISSASVASAGISECCSDIEMPPVTAPTTTSTGASPAVPSDGDSNSLKKREWVTYLLFWLNIISLLVVFRVWLSNGTQ